MKYPFSNHYNILPILCFHISFVLLLTFFTLGYSPLTLFFYVIDDWGIVRRSSYRLYNGRRTHCTTTAERSVPQVPYNNPYIVIGLK